MRLQTAWLEAQQGFPFKAQPMLLCAYQVDCENIADLSQPKGLQEFGVTNLDLACAWADFATRGETPPSWVIVRRLRASGVAGAIVPSFALGSGPDDVNVVFWDWSADPPHQVRVVDDEHRLPKDARSWL